MPRPQGTRQAQRRPSHDDEHQRYIDLHVQCLFAPEEPVENPGELRTLMETHPQTCDLCHSDDPDVLRMHLCEPDFRSVSEPCDWYDSNVRSADQQPPPAAADLAPRLAVV